MSDTAATPANPSTTLDAEAVTRYMAAHVPGFEGPVTITKFATGQSNPTFRIDSPSRAYVLRRKPMGKLLKSAHQVEREFRVQKALWGSDVPVPEMLVLCEDPEVIGSSFYIMAHVPGRNFAEPTMPGEDKATRAGVIDSMNRVLAALHEIDPEAVGLGDFGPPGDYIARQVHRWSEQYRASATETIPAMDKLMAALGRHMPPDDGQRRLVHGDYRIDNMIFHADRPECAAVLDWELSTLGHPYADLASVIMQWQLPPGNEGRGLAGVDRAALGLPSDEEFIARYCE
ncbi:MAG: phosphotransferase family protein, partial [Alphaproteobacteria bacterium]